VVDFVGLDAVDQVCHLRAVGEVSIVKKHFYHRLMRINIDMVYPGGAEGAGPSDEAVNLIALSQQ